MLSRRDIFEFLSSTRGALLGLIVGTIVLGIAPVLVRLSDAAPFALGFWRVLLSLPMLLLLCVSRRKASKRIGEAGSRKKEMFCLILAGVSLGCNLALWNLAIHYTNIANVAVLSNCSPILIALWSRWVLRQKLAPSLVMGLLIAIFGAFLLASASNHDQVHGYLGDFCSVGATVFLAAYLLSIKYARTHYSVIFVMLVVSCVSTAVLFCITLMAHESFAVHQWWTIVGLALGAHTLGQGLIAYALAYLPATFSSTGLTAQPVIASFAGWFFLSESLTALQMVGVVIVIAGIWLSKPKLVAPKLSEVDSLS